MNLEAIKQLAEGADRSTFDGIIVYAGAVTAVYEKYESKQNKVFFNKIKSLFGMTVSQSYCWRNIYKHKEKLANFKAHLPLNIYCLDIISTLTEEEIQEGIDKVVIQKGNTSAAIYRKYQNTCESYKKRNATYLNKQKQKELELQKQKEEISESQEKSIHEILTGLQDTLDAHELRSDNHRTWLETLEDKFMKVYERIGSLEVKKDLDHKELGKTSDRLYALEKNSQTDFQKDIAELRKQNAELQKTVDLLYKLAMKN